MGVDLFLIVILIVSCCFFASVGIRHDQKLAAKRRAEQPIKETESQQRGTFLDYGQSVNLDVKTTRPIRNVSPAKVGRSGIPATHPSKNSDEENASAINKGLNKQQKQQTFYKPIIKRCEEDEGKEK